MNAQAESDSSSLDTLKLIAAVGILIGAIWGFYHYEQSSQLLRVGGLVGAAVVAALIALQTATGRGIWAFAADSRTEVRKVVWPTRQETIQTTLLVFGMVLIMAIMLWLVDMFLMWIVRMVTG
jgi:preprotein translocase subunit SecE